MKFEIENGNLSLKQRIDILKNFFVSSDLNIFEINNFSDDFITFVTEINAKKITLHFLLKNIVNSGWSDKPDIKRIQVKALTAESVPVNNHSTCSLFAGFAFVNGEPIMAVWNPFMYVFHKTNRSCYINVHSLALCARDGFLKTLDSNQEVLLCNKENLLNLLKTYVERNSIE